MSIRDEFFDAGDVFAGVMLDTGKAVNVYSLTVGEKDAFEKETRRRRKKSPDKVRLLERLLIATVKDQDGQPLFTAADEDRIGGLPSKKVERLFRAACRMNGYTDDDGEPDEGN